MEKNRIGLEKFYYEVIDCNSLIAIAIETIKKVIAHNQQGKNHADIANDWHTFYFDKVNHNNEAANNFQKAGSFYQQLYFKFIAVEESFIRLKAMSNILNIGLNDDIDDCFKCFAVLMEKYPFDDFLITDDSVLKVEKTAHDKLQIMLEKIKM